MPTIFRFENLVNIRRVSRWDDNINMDLTWDVGLVFDSFGIGYVTVAVFCKHATELRVS
jgi:hypothetical protein